MFLCNFFNFFLNFDYVIVLLSILMYNEHNNRSETIGVDKNE